MTKVETLQQCVDKAYAEWVRLKVEVPQAYATQQGGAAVILHGQAHHTHLLCVAFYEDFTIDLISPAPENGFSHPDHQEAADLGFALQRASLVVRLGKLNQFGMLLSKGNGNG